MYLLLDISTLPGLLGITLCWGITMGMLSDRLTALVDALTGFEEGTVIAGFGSEPIEIFTKRVPADLYISIKDDGQTSVCQGDVNMVGYELMEDGFVLYPDVKTDSVEIDWVAIF